MNTYSKALRHISMRDVKQKHQQKLTEQKIQRKIEREEKKYIQSVMESKRYDWRKKINEQMTTSDVFFTNLPATGDVNLQYPILVSGGSNNGSISNNTITIGGNPAPYSTNGIILNFDSSLYDTLKFNINNPSGNLLGFFIGNSSAPSLIINSSGTYTLTVPQSKNLSVLLDTPDTTTMSLSGFSFQRRTPLNVFVSLDNPEASSFVRTGSGNLSPEEKQKRVREILRASDEYVRQMYGNNFPGTGAAAPGESKFTPQQLSDIDKQIKYLQAQAEKSKQDAVNNRWRAAAELAMGVVQAAAILSPIPGDEAIVAGAQAVKAGAGSAGARAFAKANPGKYNPFLPDNVNKYFRK